MSYDQCHGSGSKVWLLMTKPTAAAGSLATTVLRVCTGSTIRFITRSNQRALMDFITRKPMKINEPL